MPEASNLAKPEEIRIDGEKDTIWVPWGNIHFKPLRLEPRTGLVVAILKAGPDSSSNTESVPKHRHRGPVTAFGLKGEFEYLERGWKGKAGDYVVEGHGVVHTLFMHPGAEVLVTVMGSIEYLNEEGEAANTIDVGTFMGLYRDFCEKEGLEFNESLIF
ncbi:hypothetical protein YB2330_000357 [Saitoella coloradoensis]